MRSTKSYFNSRLFIKTVTRYWPIWSVYLFILSIVNYFIVRESVYYSYADVVELDSLYNSTITFGLIFSAIFCLATAMFSHSWMYTARSASAYACLPIKREGLFLSTSLAGVAPLILSNLVAMIVMSLTALYFGVNAFYAALLCFLALSLFNVFSYGLATFCCELTGNAFVVPFIYAIFNFLAVVVEALLKVLAGFFIYGASFSSSFYFSFLSPIYEMITKVNTIRTPESGITGWSYIIAYAVVGLILCALSLLIFKKRRMETASDIVAFNPLKPVFKYCLSFGCALTLGMLFYSIIANDFDYNYAYGCELKTIITLGICMIIAAFIGYFAAEMLIHKSFKVFKNKWKGFICVCAVIALLIAGMYFDLFGIEKYIPDTDDIRSVSFSVFGCTTEIEDADTIELLRETHSAIIADKDRNRSLVNSYMLEDESEEFLYDFRITYCLNSGRRVNREYTLFAPDFHEANWQTLVGIINRPDCIESRVGKLFTNEIIDCSIYYAIPKAHDDEIHYATEYSEDGTEMYLTPIDSPSYPDTDSKYVELTDEQAKDLIIPALNDDIKHGRISDFNYGSSGNAHSEYLYDCSINFTISQKSNNNNYFYYDSIYFTPNVNSVSTNEALKSLGVELYTVAEIYE